MKTNLKKSPFCYTTFPLLETLMFTGIHHQHRILLGDFFLSHIDDEFLVVCSQ